MSFIDLCLFATMIVGQTVVSYPSQNIHVPLPKIDSSEIKFCDEQSNECSTKSSEDLPTNNTESDYHVYTREDWNAQPATDKRPLKTPTPYVIIHHTYIPGACYNPEDCKAAMRSMQNYHMSLDWGDIGYKNKSAVLFKVSLRGKCIIGEKSNNDIDMGKKTISFEGTRLFNKLPKDLKSCESLNKSNNLLFIATSTNSCYFSF